MTKTILARLATDTLSELILMSITEKTRYRQCLLNVEIYIQIIKIANYLTNSSDGPQSKYVFFCKIFYPKYYLTIHNARQEVLRKGESDNSNA